LFLNELTKRSLKPNRNRNRVYPFSYAVTGSQGKIGKANTVVISEGIQATYLVFKVLCSERIQFKMPAPVDKHVSVGLL